MSLRQPQNNSLQEVESQLDQKIREQDVDVGYSRKEQNGQTTVYEPEFAQNEEFDEEMNQELNEYLEEIEVEGHCDADRILIDMDQGRAVLDTDEVDEAFDAVYQEIQEGEQSYFHGHAYGKQEALINFNKSEPTELNDGNQTWEDEATINARMGLITQAMTQYEFAKEAAQSEYNMVLGNSLQEELNSQGQVNEGSVVSKLEDTVDTCELGQYERQRFDSFGELVSIMDKKSDKKSWKRLSDRRLCQTNLGGDWRLMAVSGSEFDSLRDKTVYGIGINKKSNKGDYGQEHRINQWSKLSKEEIATAVQEGLEPTPIKP